MVSLLRLLSVLSTPAGHLSSELDAEPRASKDIPTLRAALINRNAKECVEAERGELISEETVFRWRKATLRVDGFLGKHWCSK